MRTKSFILFSIVIMVGSLGAIWLDQPRIDSPLTGETLQGVVTISGSTNVPGFRLAEVSFTFSGGNNWFIIATSDTVVRNGPITTWDTTTISDGNYRLRVRVYLDTGGTSDAFVDELNIRNYTTNPSTPVPAGLGTPITETVVPTLTTINYPSPTAMPSNPAILTQTGMLFSVALGFLFVAILFILLGVKLGLRVFVRRE